jgi:hypothetical protein
MSIARAHVRPALAGFLTGVLLLVTASVAGAQSAASNTATPPSAPTAVTQSTAPSPAAPYWALIGGYEWDTHGSSYGFVGPAYTHPFGSDNVAWTARVFGNYLTYEFSDLTKTTKVHSPGASAAVGLKFGSKNTFAVSAGPSVSWRKTTVTTNAGAETKIDETRTGVNLGTEISAGSANNLQILGNYNTTDKYAWGRVGAKTQLTNRTWKDANALFLGVEAIAQGNQDIKSVQFGGLFEINHVPARMSLMFRAGYKRSTFAVGDAKTGPYFGIGLYKRLN